MKKLIKIGVGDMVENAKNGQGVVKAVEMVKLYRNGAPTPRYHVTDGDYQWVVDRRDVRTAWHTDLSGTAFTIGQARACVERDLAW